MFYIILFLLPFFNIVLFFMLVILHYETAAFLNKDCSCRALAALAPPTTRPLARGPSKLVYISIAAAYLPRCSFLTPISQLQLESWTALPWHHRDPALTLVLRP